MDKITEQRPAVIDGGYRSKIELTDGVVTKQADKWFKHMKILPILKEFNSDLFPEIVDINKQNYSYRFVEGYRINFPGCWSKGTNKTDWSYYQRNMPRDAEGYGLEEPAWQVNNFCAELVELQIFKNDLVKTLYEISKKYLPVGECLIYYDLSSANIIYNNKTKKLTLVDLDGLKKESLLEFMTHYWIN